MEKLTEQDLRTLEARIEYLDILRSRLGDWAMLSDEEERKCMEQYNQDQSDHGKHRQTCTQVETSGRGSMGSGPFRCLRGLADRT